jgi:predicted RNA binding protein YcfA (HicA-like mRNA interferase family)
VTSSKPTVISGEDLIRAPKKFDYVRVRQKGSHVRFRHPTDTLCLPVTIPLYNEIAVGTLKRILRDAKISTEELNSIL